MLAAPSANPNSNLSTNFSKQNQTINCNTLWMPIKIKSAKSRKPNAQPISRSVLMFRARLSSREFPSHVVTSQQWHGHEHAGDRAAGQPGSRVLKQTGLAEISHPWRRLLANPSCLLLLWWYAEEAKSSLHLCGVTKTYLPDTQAIICI